MFYSKDTGGFYDAAIHGNKIPSDAVEITADQHAALIDGQSNGQSIEADENGRPVLVSPPAQSRNELEALAWERIKAERDRRSDTGGYKVGTKWFHSDIKSRTQQLGLVQMGASIPAGLQWKTMDGSFVTMTQTLAGQILAAAAAADQAIFAAAETHKAAMMASADPASYNYLSGWPAGFGE